MDDERTDLLAAWGVYAVESIEVPALGTMNETWLVRHAGGAVVLRRHRRSDRTAVAFEHEVLDHARTHGVPCPSLVATPGGERIVERGGRLNSLYSWEPGVHVERGHAGPVRSYAAGAMLARVHDALSRVMGGPIDGEGPGDLSETYRRIEHLHAVVRVGGIPGRAWILEDLEARWAWLETNECAPAECVGDLQLIHGDYQLTNLLFEGDAISAVIDWDKARVASPLMEVVRSLDHGIGLAPNDIAAFLAGYRARRPLSESQLAAAVEYWTHQQARSLWVLDRICLDGDLRVERLASPFRPFAERWAEIGIA